jgi:hypothetical protein
MAVIDIAGVFRELLAGRVVDLTTLAEAIKALMPEPGHPAANVVAHAEVDSDQPGVITVELSIRSPLADRGPTS